MRERKLLSHASSCLAYLLAAALLLRPGPSASAQQEQARIDSVWEACLAADTATGWKEVAVVWSKRAVNRGSNDSLRTRLLELEKRDQAIRMVPNGFDSMGSPDFLARMRAVDSLDAAALSEIVARYGWPTRELVGDDGVSAALLIIQHNPRLQKPMLKRLLALPAGEVSPSELAYLQDRILTHDGKPQIYGTQVRRADDGKTVTFDPIEDVAHVDERRAKVGLSPLDTYICLTRGAYEMDVVDPRTSTGPPHSAWEP